MTLRKWGACAAPVLALLYVVGIVLNATLLNTSGIPDALARTRFQVENQGAMSAFVLVLYVFFGCLVVVVSLATHERLSDSAPALTRASTVFALIWATLLIGSGLVFHAGMAEVAAMFPHDPSGAASLMKMVEVVHEGLGCTAEIPGGLWMLLSSLPALRSRALHPLHAWTGVVAGSAGILSALPFLFVPCVGLYVLMSLVWFVWMGFFLHRPCSNPA